MKLRGFMKIKEYNQQTHGLKVYKMAIIIITVIIK